MMTPADIDELEAAKAVHAIRTHNTTAFNQAIDDAFSRPGGVERIVRILATQLAQSEVQ